MHIEFDPAKSARNFRERGLSFERAAEFDFDTTKLWQDTRQSYPESRYVALGYLANRLHVTVFCTTTHGIRIISFRRANLREGVQHGFPLTRD